MILVSISLKDNHETFRPLVELEPDLKHTFSVLEKKIMYGVHVIQYQYILSVIALELLPASFRT